MRYLRLLPALSLLAAARPALAQGSSCPVDIYQPAGLFSANTMINRAAQNPDSATAQKPLKDAMKFLQDDRKFTANPVGLAYLRAQIMVLWLHQPGGAETMTREQLNMGGVKTESLDLISTADSLLKMVEAVDPTCANETYAWRAARPWTSRIQRVYALLDSNRVDDAERLAKRAAQLYAASPYVHNAFAQIAQKRNDNAATLAHLRIAIEQAAKDTSLATMHRQMRFQLAQVAQGYAMTDGSAQKAALLKESLDAYVGLLREAPASEEGSYAFQSASEIVQLSQDTAAARALLEPMVADPSPYSDLTLLLGADLARAGSRDADAMALYAGALAKNPNIRDANYFLAYMYYNAKQPDKMIPLTERLLEIDPSNGDNYQMRAVAYQLMFQAERDPRKKAELQKQFDEWSAKENALAAQHRLTVNRFERRREGAALGGEVENLTKAPKTFTVRMMFLDTAGNVLETMTAEVKDVKPGEKGKFEFTPTTRGIVAYKYEALK